MQDYPRRWLMAILGLVALTCIAIAFAPAAWWKALTNLF
jgi:hypothetical protein